MVESLTDVSSIMMTRKPEKKAFAFMTVWAVNGMLWIESEKEDKIHVDGQYWPFVWHI